MAAIFFVAVVVLDERLESVKLDDGRVLSGEDDFAQIFRGERFFLLYQFDFALLFFFTLFVNFLSSWAHFYAVFSTRIHRMFMLG